MIAPPEFMPTLTALHGNFFISSNEFVQWAALAALREAGAGGRPLPPDLRRAPAGDGGGPRAASASASARRPPARSTCWPTRAATRRTRCAFAFEILERTHVAVTPGVDFGRNAEGYLRFAYANSLERIEEALARLGRFLAERAP